MSIETVQAKFAALAPVLNERSRRLWAATEAKALGHGGIATVERATGISRSTIQRGIREIECGDRLSQDRSRRAGAGRKATIEKDPGLLSDLDALVEPTTAGDPDSPLRWTLKSVRALAARLQKTGHDVSHTLVAELLHELGWHRRDGRANGASESSASPLSRRLELCNPARSLKAHVGQLLPDRL